MSDVIENFVSVIFLPGQQPNGESLANLNLLKDTCEFAVMQIKQMINGNILLTVNMYRNVFN